MADKTQVYEVIIKANYEELAKLNNEIEESKKLTKELSETDKAAAEQQKIITKQKTAAYNQLTKEAKAAEDASQKEIQTLAKMRAELARLNKTAENADFGSDAFKKAQKEATELRKKINDVDQAAGKFQGNVGNYKNAVIDAFQAMGVNVGQFTSTVSSVSTAFSGATRATAGTSAAMKILKVALISTGIGALVVALGTLIAAFATTEKGSDAVAKVMKPLGSVMERLFGIVQKVGLAFADLFSGNFAQGFKDLKAAFTGIGSELSDAWKEGEKLFQVGEDIEGIRLKIAQNEGRITRELTEQKEIYMNQTLTDNERKAAAEKYLELNKELTGYKIEQSQLELEQMKLDKQSDQSMEYQIELAEKQSELDAIIAESNQETLKTKNFINGISKQTNDETLKAQQEQFALQQKQEQSAFDAINALLALKQVIQPDPEKAIFTLFPEEFEDGEDPAIEMMRSSAEKGLQIFNEFNQAKKGKYEEDLNNLQNAFALGLISEEEFNQGRLDLRKEYNQNILAETANLLNGLAEIFGKESKAGKAAAIAATAINTYVSAMAAFKSGVTYGGPFGLALGISSAAIATAFGLAQIAKITNTKDATKPKYARGVIGLHGSGTETSDSIDARLSKGESVMTAKATSEYAPILAQMEMAVGNRPNYQVGNKRFANGLIGLNPNTSILSNTEQIIRETIKAVGSIPVVVSEQEITSTQSRVRKIKVAGDL